MSEGHYFAHENSWCVELLTEWGASEAAGSQRRQHAMWVDSQQGVDEGDELRALKTALARLAAEHSDEYAAVVAEFKARRRFAVVTRATHGAVLGAAINRLAAWVDAACDA